jgi:hypothetical protein
MRDNIIVRLVVYYAVTVLVVAGLFRVFPQIGEYQVAERMRSTDSASLTLDSSPKSGTKTETGQTALSLLSPERSVPILLALVTAFLVTLPLTWVYRWTRPRMRYSQAFAHTLLVVPIAIALVVFLVKGSLPLAFSLAGIVGALRFRTSLNEPMDAVYMFMVIGTGLAAGVQLLAVAFLASLFFNAVALMVWRTDFGAQPAIIDGWRIVQPDETGQLLGVSGVATPQAETQESQEGQKNPYNAKLRVHTTQVEAAQRATIPILEAYAKRWKIKQVVQQEDGTSVVEFDLRLKKTAELAAFIRQIEESETEYVNRVELTKNKSAKKKSDET